MGSSIAGRRFVFLREAGGLRCRGFAFGLLSVYSLASRRAEAGGRRSAGAS